MNFRFNFRVKALFLVILLLMCGTLHAGASDDRHVLHLFSENDAELRSLDVVDSALGFVNFKEKNKLEKKDLEFLSETKRFRPVSINMHAVQPDQLVKGRTIFLHIFDDAHMFAKIDDAVMDVNGVYTVSAKIEGSEHGYAILSFSDDKLLLTVTIPEHDQEFLMNYAWSLSRHVIQEIDPALKIIPESHPPLISPDYEGLDDLFFEYDDEISSTEDTRIDLMIVYSIRARAWAFNNATHIDHVIAQAISKSNNVLKNSRVGITLRLVHSNGIHAEHTERSDVALTRLQNRNDGHMDAVHAWRNIYGADLVTFLENFQQETGIGNLLTRKNGEPDRAFNVCNVRLLHTSYVLIHEIGHNLGAHHHKLQRTQRGPTVFPRWRNNRWSAGWRFADGAERKCTVMTYQSAYVFGSNPQLCMFEDCEPCTRLPYFSNPNINYKPGMPLGHAIDADNARTLRVTKHAVANYRPTKWIRTLTVRSTGATRVRILTTPAPYWGVTEYKKPVIENTTVTLTAPPTHTEVRNGVHQRRLFRQWTGCDATNTSARTCTVRMNIAKNVAAHYGCPAETRKWGQIGDDIFCSAHIQWADNGTEHTLSNTRPFYVGSATYKCKLGHWVLQTGTGQCYRPCPQQTVRWMNNCYGSISMHAHNTRRSVGNALPGWFGRAEFLCTNGIWRYQSGNCNRTGCPSQTVRWGDSGDKEGCTGTTPDAAHNEMREVTNTSRGYIGNASYLCLGGTWRYQSGYCNPRGCPIQTVRWGGKGECTGTTPDAAHNEMREVTNTSRNYIGSAFYRCNQGSWSFQSGTCSWEHVW